MKNKKISQCNHTLSVVHDLSMDKARHEEFMGVMHAGTSSAIFKGRTCVTMESPCAEQELPESGTGK